MTERAEHKASNLVRRMEKKITKDLQSHSFSRFSKPFQRASHKMHHLEFLKYQKKEYVDVQARPRSNFFVHQAHLFCFAASGFSPEPASLFREVLT